MNISASALAITFAITATAFPVAVTVDGIVGPSVAFAVTARVAHKQNIYPLGLNIAFAADCTYQAPNNPASIATAAQDIISQWRQGCIDNPNDRVKQQLLYCLNTGLQQLYASSRIIEFVVNMRVTQYPPEYQPIKDAGGKFYAGDTYRFQSAWYVVLTSYDTTIVSGSPTTGDASTNWAKVFERDSDLFNKGIALPSLGRTINGVPEDRRLQHVARVQYADQRYYRKRSWILSAVHQTELGTLRILHNDAEVGGTGTWFEDSSLPGTEVSGDAHNSGTTVTMDDPITVVPGMYVEAAGGSVRPGTRVASVTSSTVLVLDNAPQSAINGDSLTFTPNEPPLFFEVFRDASAGGRIMIRCFPSMGRDTDNYIFVEWCPAAQPITWDDVDAGTPFDIALPYIEMYLLPLVRHAALQSKYFPAEDVPVYGPGITARYQEVLKMLNLSDIQPPAAVQPPAE